jgi:hypothetical protein
MAKKKQKDEIDFIDPRKPELDLISKFTEHYEVAHSFRESDTFWNAAQVLSFVDSLFPGYDYIGERFLEELQEYGYQKDVVDGEVMWLLKSV